MTTCGDLGGETLAGAPCRRPAKDGLRCRQHREPADAEAERIKAAFLEAYEETPVLDAAAKRVGRAYVTIWRWRKADPAFDAAVAEREAEAADRRYQMVEDGLFMACVKGTHKGGERMFFLVNESRRRADGRWKNTTHVKQETTNVDLTKLTEEELERVVAGEDPLLVVADTRLAARADSHDE